MKTSPILEIAALSKRFGNQTVLQNIDLSLGENEFLAVLGQSGSGKTTLLRLIAGFDAPDSGRISFEGRVVAEPSAQTFVPAEKRRIGFVPQDASLFPHLNVSQNIAFGLTAFPRAEREARVSELLELTRLSEFADASPGKLSGGQRHRIALARALAPRPSLVLLDEPYSALDPELRLQLRVEVRDLLKESGAAAILVSHDQEEVLSIADRVALLRNGEFVQIGTPSDVYAAPADLGVATFIGDSVIVAGVVRAGKLETSLGKLVPLNQVAEGQSGRVAIRPENFYLQPNLKGDGVVVGRQFFGHDAVLEVQLPGQLIRARSNGPFAPEIGMRVTVWVRGAVNFYAD